MATKGDDESWLVPLPMLVLLAVMMIIVSFVALCGLAFMLPTGALRPAPVPSSCTGVH